MTPEQIDTVTDGLINLHDFVDQHGPGLAAAAIAVIGWCAMWCRLQRQTRRDQTTADGIRRIEQYANDPTHRDPRKEDTP